MNNISEKMQSKSLTPIAEQRGTINESLDLMKAKLDELRNLASFSERVVIALNREERVDKTATEPQQDNPEKRTFPEEFSTVAIYMEKYINEIGRNLNHIKETIG